MMDAGTPYCTFIGGRKMSRKKAQESNLKGTLYMTFAIGAIIIAVWAACFSIFMGRM